MSGSAPHFCKQRRRQPPLPEANAHPPVEEEVNAEENVSNDENLESNGNLPPLPQISAGVREEAEMSYVNTAKPSTPQPYPARQDITRQITEKAQPLQNFSSASMRNGSNLAQAAVEEPAADSPGEPAVKKLPTVQATVILPGPKEEKKEPLRSAPTKTATTPLQPVTLKAAKTKPLMTATVRQSPAPSQLLQAPPVSNMIKTVAPGYQPASPVTAQQSPFVVKRSDEAEKQPSPLTRLMEEAKKVLPVTAQQPLGLFDAPLKGDIHLELSGRSLIGRTVKISENTAHTRKAAIKSQ